MVGCHIMFFVDCCMCESVLRGALTNVCAAANGKQAARTITYNIHHLVASKVAVSKDRGHRRAVCIMVSSIIKVGWVVVAIQIQR